MSIAIIFIYIDVTLLYCTRREDGKGNVHVRVLLLLFIIVFTLFQHQQQSYPQGYCLLLPQ